MRLCKNKPHVHEFAFPAETGHHLTTTEGRKAELAYMVAQPVAQRLMVFCGMQAPKIEKVS